MTKIKEVTSFLEHWAPLSSQETYDNSGLIVGDPENEITGVLISLDCTEEIVQEAIDKKCNLIVSHHPIIFSGLKKLNGKNYVERTVIKAIKNDISLYAIHTNLDNAVSGVNHEIGKRLGLEKLQILRPKSGSLLKLNVMTPKDSLEKVKKALFEGGAGKIGNYEECSFEQEGLGNFKPVEGADPTIGELYLKEETQEIKVEVILKKNQISSVLKSMFEAHPYEEVAYDLIQLENQDQYEGAGMYGELETEIDSEIFIQRVKETFNCKMARCTAYSNKKIKKVAFCGGSGSFLLSDAKGVKADIYITGDMKYHEFFDAENKIIICDIGHYESEQFTSNLIDVKLKEKFTNFAVYLTGLNTNPINYI